MTPLNQHFNWYCTWLDHIGLCLREQSIRLSVSICHASHPVVSTATETAEWMKVFMSQQPWQCRECKTTWKVQEISYRTKMMLNNSLSVSWVCLWSDLLNTLLNFILSILSLSQDSKKLYSHNKQWYIAQIIPKIVHSYTYIFTTEVLILLWTTCTCAWVFYSICLSVFSHHHH